MGCLLDKALKVADAIKKDIGDMTQERRDTLADVMAATGDQVVAEIIKINKWTETDTTKKYESEILKTHKAVLTGKGNLINFKEACQRWKTEGIKQI